MLTWYPRHVCKHEFTSQQFKRFNERPIEFGFVFRKIGELYPRTVIDIGSGTTALPHLIRNCGCLVTATDNIRDYWPNGMSNRHFHVIDDNIVETRIAQKFDLVTCVSVLEHIQRPDDAVRNMFSLTNSNGHLILTFPYNENQYIENVYDLPGSSYGQRSPYATQQYCRSDIERWISKNQGVVVEQEYWQFWSGDHWTVGSQIIPPRQVAASDRHQLSCLLLKRA